MPIIDLTISKETLSTENRNKLLDKVGQLAIGYEGLSGSKFAEDFTWIYVHELPTTHVSQYSGKPPKPLYRFVFTTRASTGWAKTLPGRFMKSRVRTGTSARLITGFGYSSTTTVRAIGSPAHRSITSRPCDLK